jgi:hypothetical protein
MYYNFGRIHKTLRVAPAMEAGIADHVWSSEEIAALVPEPDAKKRGLTTSEQIEGFCYSVPEPTGVVFEYVTGNRFSCCGNRS